MNSINDFEIIGKKIGSGTYGEVKLGKNIKTGKIFALKIINNQNLKSPEKNAI